MTPSEFLPPFCLRSRASCKAAPGPRDVRWRGSYAYIDAATPDGDMWQLCRLKWNGHHDHWEFAIYLASRDGYEPNILPSGWPTGTPEEAIDCAGLLYLNDWAQPPKD